MNNFRILPEKSNARHLFMEITTDALKESGIPKGANVYVRKVKKWKLEQPTAWRMHDGQIRITCAFEDADNVILYSPKDENLMDIFHKSEVQFLGRVMCVKTDTEDVPVQKSRAPETTETAAAPDPDIKAPAGIRMMTDHFEWAGLKKDYAAMIIHGAQKTGDLVAAYRKKTGDYILGVLNTIDGKYNLPCGGDDWQPRIYSKSDLTILGKIVGYCKPGSSKILPLEASR